MVKLTGRKKSSETPKIAVINEIENNGLKNAKVVKTHPKKKRETLTETEQEVLDDIIEGRLSQYPLVTKNGSTRYAKTHKRTASLKKKLLRMGLLPKDD